MLLSKILNTNFKTGLQKLLNADIPLRSAFKLKGILQEVNNALKTYDEVRLEAVKKYGIKKDDGTLETHADGNVKFDPEEYDKFAKELTDLLATDINIGKVKLEELGNKVEISVDDLMHLEEIIDTK